MQHRKSLWRKKSNREYMIPLTGMLTLLSIIMAVMLHYSGKYQETQVYRSYCSGYGFAQNFLVLMKDHTYRFHFYGCSQNFGLVEGDWRLENGMLRLERKDTLQLLETRYLFTQDSLKPFTPNQNHGFVDCNLFSFSCIE